MESLFFVLFFAMIGGSIWGGIVLAIRWVKHPLARVGLALLLMTLFAAAGTTAIIAGCTAIFGSPNFH